MKKKKRSFFSAHQAVGFSEQADEKKKMPKLTTPLTRTSLDPLYSTTDKYRRVIKPMKVEDFLKN